MSQKITNKFAALKAQGRTALITYIMSHDPDEKTSRELLLALPEYGSDLVELGVPFSDPMADGPTIQQAAINALKAGGSLKKALPQAQAFTQKHPETPLIIMGYFNLILHYGVEAFFKDAKAIGIDGLIIVDLPPEEGKDIFALAQSYDIAIIRLIAPSTPKERIKTIVENASGFIYYISILGVTGTTAADPGAIKNAIDQIRHYTNLPIVAGFGINNAAAAEKIAPAVDGIVVGSAIVKQVENYSNQPQKIQHFVESLSAVLG